MQFPRNEYNEDKKEKKKMSSENEDVVEKKEEKEEDASIKDKDASIKEVVNAVENDVEENEVYELAIPPEEEMLHIEDGLLRQWRELCRTTPGWSTADCLQLELVVKAKIEEKTMTYTTTVNKLEREVLSLQRPTLKRSVNELLAPTSFESDWHKKRREKEERKKTYAKRNRIKQCRDTKNKRRELGYIADTI